MFKNVTPENLYEQLKENEPYQDFATAVINGVSNGKVNEMVEFLNKNPNADDQDILEELADLRGIKNLNEESD